MRTTLSNVLGRLVSLVRPHGDRNPGDRRKSAPAALTGNQWSGTSFIDSFKRERSPTANELMAELKNTAFTCATMNAAVCAARPPKLFVATNPKTQMQARCFTKPIDARTEKRLRGSPILPPHITNASGLEEVLTHPLLTLLRQVNPVHNSFDLWELTTLYQEVHGCAYWYLDIGPLGIPQAIWILPSQNVTPERAKDSPRPVDFYQYRAGATEQRFAPERVVHFRYPDPRDPYTGGLSPLRACYEQVALMSDYAAMKKAIYENRGLPSAIVSPDGGYGEEERDRLETQ